MQRLLCTICVVFLALACQSDLLPDDKFYQRWQLVQTRQGTGGWVADTSTALSDTEYKRMVR